MTIAYLTGEYPRATDTFIQREVAALRALGLDIATCTIRRTGPEHLTGPEQGVNPYRGGNRAEAVLWLPVVCHTFQANAARRHKAPRPIARSFRPVRPSRRNC